MWPNLSFYVHGGVAMEPYKKGFEKLLGKPITYIETYLASEGFLAYQNRQDAVGMPLALNNNIFFEFVPFDENNFINITEAPEQIALAKFLTLSLFCSHLGAKSIRVEQIERIGESGKAEAKYNFSALNFEGSSQDEVMHKMVRSITQFATFAGGDPHFEIAQELIERSGVSDITFSSLLEMRRAPNQVQRVEQNFSLTKEVRTSLDRLRKVHFPEQLGELSRTISEVAQRTSEYAISIVIEF